MRPRAFVAWAAALLLAACDKGSAPSGGAAGSPPPRPSASTSAAPTAAHSSPKPTPKPPPEPCKAASVAGSVGVVPFVGGLIDGGPLPVTQSGILPDDAWIDVGKGG